MRTLTPREKALLIAAAILVATLGVMHRVVWPAHASKQQSLAHLAKYETVSAVLDTLPAVGPGPASAPLPPLRQRVNEINKSAGLEPRRLDPQGAEVLSVSFEDVPFAALVGWVDALNSAAQVHVLSAEIGRRPEPGIISANFVLGGL